jgi:hypothetical protein
MSGIVGSLNRRDFMKRVAGASATLGLAGKALAAQPVKAAGDLTAGSSCGAGGLESAGCCADFRKAPVR